MLLFTDGETSSLSQQKTIFHQARQEGFNTAIVGYFLPYCAILGPALSQCAQPSNDDLWSRSFWAHVKDQWQRELNRNWLLVRVDSKARFRMPWFGWGTRTEQRNAYLYIESAARDVATDRDMGLILLHLPIPHLLGIYNRHTGQLTYDQPSNYLDNLALADRTLGELRNWLDKAGLWDETTLVVSADHPLRAKAWMKMSSWTKEEADLSENKTFPYIPFIVKTAHNNRGLEYREQFDTILTNRLVLGMLEGKLNGVDDVAGWLDAHRKEAPILLPE
jgi:type I phosphodiesterase/nucleotide pyrophosphatase